MKSPSDTPVTAAKKKPYSPPVLTEIGRVADLTQGGLSAGNDSGAGHSKNDKGPK